MSQAPPVDEATTAHEEPISLGRELRRAREVRGYTLPDVAAETRISERYLRALEGDQLEVLPGEVYARNFVRLYARAIGADEDEFLDYLGYQERRRVDTSPAPAASGTPTSWRRILSVGALVVAAVVIVAVLAWSLREGARTEGPGPAGPGRAAATPAELPAAGAEAGGRPQPAAEGPGAPAEAGMPARDTSGGAPGQGGEVAEERVAEPPSRPAPSAPRPTDGAGRSAAEGPEVVVAAAPAAATGTAERPAAEDPPPVLAAAAPPREEPAAPAEAPDRAPVLRLEFREESWVEVRRRGSADPDLFGLRRAGTVLTFALDDPLEILLGNAGGVVLRVDDAQGRPLGARGENRTIRIDRQNYRSFLP